jgi:O-acetyl-ADP-ribose deacetylase (regulator of RNase III)
MINSIKGDVLTSSGIIAHCVNNKGVMGSGIALSIRNKWPKAFEEYQKRYRQWKDTEERDSEYGIFGECQLVQVSDTVAVANIGGQWNYGNDGKKYVRYDALDTAFAQLYDMLPKDSKNRTVVNFPLLGCDRAGGEWSIVSAIIDFRLPDEYFIKNLYTL